MSKFVPAIAEVNGAVNITVEEFQKAIVNHGGLQSTLAFYVDQAVVDFADEKQIYIVDSSKDVAINIATVLNQKFAERAEAGEEPSYEFAGTAGVAYGSEVVSANDTAAAALANVTKTKTTQTKGANQTMNTTTATESIKSLVAAGVNDNDALAIAMKLKAAKKNNAGATQITNNVKENVQMNNRRGTVKQEGTAATETQAQGTSFVFGGTTQTKTNNNGGTNMNTTTQTKEETKAPASTRRGSGSTGQAPAQNNSYNPSYSFSGRTQDQVVADNTGRTGFDETDRESEMTDGFEGAWYCNPNKFPILKDFGFYFANRRNLPVNPYGITKINFLNPQDKKVVEYDNKYEIVVELCFGQGTNYRIKLSRVTADMKAQKEAKGFKASKSDWSTGNIKWMEKAGQLVPRYAFSVRNGISLNVVCGCGKQHTVNTAHATTCKCGKKFNAVQMAPVGESANLKFSDYQSDWTPVVLDNFNVKVHKDLLALALACASFERGLPVYGLDEQK